MSEEKLVKKAVKGDERAFGKLYDAYISPIYRYIILRVGNKSVAEDITQEVFLSVWKNINDFQLREGVPFSSYLYKVARNKVIDYYRTEKSSVDIAQVEFLYEDWPDYGLAIDDSLIVQKIKEQLKFLSADEREVIILKYVNELENKEIAEIISKTEGAVRVIQHRALKKLKEFMLMEKDGK